MTALADSYKLEIEFPTGGISGSPFILNDATLGQLNGTGKLGGLFYADVTSDLVSIEIFRGRSRQLDTFDSGTMTFKLRNNSRTYDPTNTASPYYGGILPRRKIRFSANNNYLYTGWIDDWNIDYSIPTESAVTGTCVDAFSVLASILLDEFTFTSGQRTDQRITTVLALPEVSGVGTPSVDALSGIVASLETGDSRLADDTVAIGTTALDYLQRVNRSEQGYLFVNGQGELRFRRRNTNYNTTIPVFTDTTPSTNEYKYTQVSIQYGTENLYNRVVVTNDGGTPQTVSDGTSEARYLTRSLEISDLILENDAQALSIANFLLGKYANPEFRFDSVTISLQNLSGTAQNALLSLEPNDIVAVKRTFSTGSPLTVQKYGIIEGITHQVSLIEHTITFSLSPAQASLRLDNPLFGVLDSNTLGF